MSLASAPPWWFRSGVTLVALAAATAAVALWLLPIELFQQWNVRRAGLDPYARFEAAGQAEALTWLGRALLPLIAASFALLRLRSTAAWRCCQEAAAGCLRATTGRGAWLQRAIVLAWIGLFISHLGASWLERGRDWAYFRLNSGADVLPNISFENRAVIRYLREATPAGARILVCSDQSLYFLSYYLLPSRLFYKVHPDAEFTIPQAGQTRPLKAYRLVDWTRAEIASLRPDYVLEYFEGPDYVEPARLTEDADWIAFWRASTGERGLPPYLVALRSVTAEPPP